MIENGLLISNIDLKWSFNSKYWWKMVFSYQIIVKIGLLIRNIVQKWSFDTRNCVGAGVFFNQKVDCI